MPRNFVRLLSRVPGWWGGSVGGVGDAGAMSVQQLQRPGEPVTDRVVGGLAAARAAVGSMTPFLPAGVDATEDALEGRLGAPMYHRAPTETRPTLYPCPASSRRPCTMKLTTNYETETGNRGSHFR